MKILFKPLKHSSEKGSVLIVALIFGVVCAITLTSYLTLIGEEHREVARSQNWNQALALAESGIEEGLTQINSTNVFSANGWGTAGGNYGPVKRTLGKNYYIVSVQNTTPVSIYATGFVAVADTGQTLSRKVKITVTNSKSTPFSVGLGAVNNINMNGNSVATDSWNSHSNWLSTNGLYSSSMINSNGDVASEDGVVNIGNHTIDGSLYLGPTASYTSGTNQVTGKIYFDYNVQFPNVTAPTVDTNGNAINWQAATLVSNKYTFTSANNGGYYTLSSLTAPIIVSNGVSVTIHITATNANFNPSSITIAGGTTNSGTLVMYQDSGSVSLSGNSAAGGNRPENFLYFGSVTNMSITLSGTSSFIGAIYAPGATLTLNGGGNSNDLMGSAIVKSVTLNGHYNFHYDLWLQRLSLAGSRGYIAISWQEL